MEKKLGEARKAENEMRQFLLESFGHRREVERHHLEHYELISFGAAFEMHRKMQELAASNCHKLE